MRNLALGRGLGRRRLGQRLVALFDLAHEIAAAEEVGAELRGDGAGDGSELIADHLREIDGAAGGDEMSAPLKHEGEVPKNETGENNGREEQGGAGGGEKMGKGVEENGEAEDEQRSERDEEAIAEGGDAGPVRIARDEDIESQDGGEKRQAGGRMAAGKQEKTEEGKDDDGSPSEETVVGGEQDLEENRGAPEPFAKRNVAGGEGASVKDRAGEESGEQRNKNDGAEKEMAEDQRTERGPGGSRGGRWRGSSAAEGGAVLREGLPDENGEERGVWIVDVEHEASNEGENEPL